MGLRCQRRLSDKSERHLAPFLCPMQREQLGANQWHHVQIYFSHNESGWVTYHSVWLDGAEQDLNFTVFSGYALGWGPAIVTNFQIDGNSSGTTWGNVYLDEMTVYRW